MGFGKKLRHTVKHITRAPAQVVHEIGHATKNVVHETGKVTNNIVNAPKKVIHSIVKEKVNAAFEKKMLEEIDNVEKELGERKAQDKAILDQAITNKINQAAEKYKNLTNSKALQEAELELMEMFRMLTAAIHDCRYGYKDSVEDILKLEFNDYRVMEFLNKRPLLLTLQNFANHKNLEALSILLPYFAQNFQKLSAENQKDYMVLKEHVSKYAIEKSDFIDYFSNLKSPEDILKNLNSRESITGNNWTPLHVAVHLGDAKMVKTLLANGALILKDKNGLFPDEVHLSGQYMNQPEGYNEAKQAIKAVIEQGRNVSLYAWPKGHDILTHPNVCETTTGYNWTPLHAAVHHGDVKLVKYLLDHGAIVVRDASKRLPNEVPLWPALSKNSDCIRGYQECVHLIKNIPAGMGIRGVGAMYPWQDDILKNPNCRELMTGYHWTPLHAAVHHADVALVKYLLAHGAVLATDARNRYPCSAPLWPALANDSDCLRRYQEAVQLTNPQVSKSNGVVEKIENVAEKNISAVGINKIVEAAKAGIITVTNNMITTGVKATVSQNTISSTANVLSQLTAGKTDLLEKSNKEQDSSNEIVATLAATTNTTLPTQPVSVTSKNPPVIEALTSIVCRP